VPSSVKKQKAAISKVAASFQVRGGSLLTSIFNYVSLLQKEDIIQFNCV
jgi:hypothetical protein